MAVGLSNEKAQDLYQYIVDGSTKAEVSPWEDFERLAHTSDPSEPEPQAFDEWIEKRPIQEIKASALRLIAGGREDKVCRALAQSLFWINFYLGNFGGKGKSLSFFQEKLIGRKIEIARALLALEVSAYKRAFIDFPGQPENMSALLQRALVEIVKNPHNKDAREIVSKARGLLMEEASRLTKTIEDHAGETALPAVSNAVLSPDADFDTFIANTLGPDHLRGGHECFEKGGSRPVSDELKRDWSQLIEYAKTISLLDLQSLAILGAWSCRWMCEALGTTKVRRESRGSRDGDLHSFLFYALNRSRVDIPQSEIGGHARNATRRALEAGFLEDSGGMISLSLTGSRAVESERADENAPGYHQACMILFRFFTGKQVGAVESEERKKWQTYEEQAKGFLFQAFEEVKLGNWPEVERNLGYLTTRTEVPALLITNILRSFRAWERDHRAKVDTPSTEDHADQGGADTETRSKVNSNPGNRLEKRITWAGNGKPSFGSKVFDGPPQSVQILRVLVSAEGFRVHWETLYKELNPGAPLGYEVDPTAARAKREKAQNAVQTAFSRLRKAVEKCWGWTVEQLPERNAEGFYLLNLLDDMVDPPPDSLR